MNTLKTEIENLADDTMLSAFIDRYGDVDWFTLSDRLP